MKDILPQLLEGFFLQWMAAGRQLSPETVASYRDAFSLMLRWFRDERAQMHRRWAWTTSRQRT